MTRCCWYHHVVVVVAVVVVAIGDPDHATNQKGHLRHGHGHGGLWTCMCRGSWPGAGLASGSTPQETRLALTRLI